MEQITLIQPDDWHLHVRTGELLKAVIAFTANQFGRAIIMPNLTPPVTAVGQALAYRKEILQSLPPNNLFNPLMTLYLTEKTTLDDVKQASSCEHVYAFKLYPSGATTNSASGVKQLQAVYPVLEHMQKLDIPLLIHGEVTDSETDIFDREKIFIDTKLTNLVQQFPKLRIVLEHVTTQEAIQFVEEAPNTIAATITPQHLMFNRNAILVGGIKPHYYCLPIIKRESHRQALVKAAVSGNPKFFLGTDSAPHLQQFKESDCGCAGCFSAATAIELYAEIFEQSNALDKLEGFASFYGPDFYRLPRNTLQITLQKTNWKVPDAYPVNDDKLIPLQAGQNISWKLLPH